MTKRVLVVEDDDTLRSAYSTKLTMEGFEVATASDGFEGLRQAEEHEPDVILLDLKMPGMSGIELLEAYELKERHPHVMAIVFSNLMVPGLAQRVIELGAVRFLTKATVTPREMVRVIREVLEGSGAMNLAPVAELNAKLQQQGVY